MALEFKLPELGENVHQGTVIRVMVAAGDTVAKEQGVLEVETDKAAVEVPSSVAGKVLEVKVKAGDTIAPGQVVFTVDGAPAPKAPEPAKLPDLPALPPAPKPAPPPPPPPVAPAGLPDIGESSLSSVPASPQVRRFAREIGVDLSRVRGSGAGGTISMEDVKAFSQSRAQAPAAAPKGAPSLPDFSQWGAVERAPMSGIRRATAEQMARAWAQVPAVTQHDRADITEFEELRKKHSGGGRKLTVTAVALKLCAAALKHFPQFNASLDEAAGEVVLKKYCHVGVAVDTEKGLLVPVIRDADKKTILQLSEELAGVSEKARAGKLSLPEMKGGCMTITNLGGIGGTSFSPIVNWPEAAILGMSRASMQPVYVNGSFAPRLLMPLSLSYDHRLVDGADAARFLRWICDAFEKPMLLAFEGLV